MAEATPPQVILAFDYGTQRIGVATGDTLTRTARPLTTLAYPAGKLPWDAIDRLNSDFTPVQFIVGVPYNMDGSPTRLTAESRRFASSIKTRYMSSVVLVDERLSSREGEAALRAARAGGIRQRRLRRADVDSAAAAVLLERWFDNPSAVEQV